MLLFGQRWASNRRGLPVSEKETSATITSVTGETVSLYYYTAPGVLTADAGQAAGTVVVAQLAYNNIKNSLGSMQGSVTDTSLTFTSSDLTSEVHVNLEEMEEGDFKSGQARAIAITNAFSNGQYCVDYSKGLIYGVKASTGTSLTAAAYKVKSGSSSSSSGGTSNITQWGSTTTSLGQKTMAASVPVVLPSDQFPTAAPSDALSNPTVMSFGSYMSAWANGVWTRVRAGITTITSSVQGYINVIPVGMYNTTPSTRTNGYSGFMELDSTGNQRTADQYAPQYEDNTNGIAQVMVKPLASSTYAPTLFQNIGANATLNVKATTGNLFSLYCHNLTANDRWIQIHNTATTPGGAAVPRLSFYVPPLGVCEKGMGDFFSAAGLNYSTGIAFALSTTEGTYTAATATDHFTQLTYV